MTSHVDDDAYDAELATLTESLAGGPVQSYRWSKRALAAATHTDLEVVRAIDAEGQQLLLIRMTSAEPQSFPEASAARVSRRLTMSACSI